MWDEISYHEQIHENCIHICLPEVTINPFNDYDLEKEVEDSESCYFLGKGIFCFPWNELRGENNVQYEKQIVPLKKFIVIVKRMSLIYVLYMKMMKNMKNP